MCGWYVRTCLDGNCRYPCVYMQTCLCSLYMTHFNRMFDTKITHMIELEYRVSDLYGGRRACVIATFMGKYVRM